jgi:hypothetical protein
MRATGSALSQVIMRGNNKVRRRATYGRVTLRRLYRSLRDRAIDHLADNDMWFALAAFCVLAVPALAFLLY